VGQANVSPTKFAFLQMPGRFCFDVETMPRAPVTHISVEPIETRLLFAVAYPTSLEQLMVEYINRARSDPAGEAARFGIALNEGLAANTISTATKPPLAINPLLTDAARSHVEWLLANNKFQHEGVNNNSPKDRMEAAGYAFTGSWTFGENLGIRGPVFEATQATSIESLHRGLFIDAGIAGRGHRVSMLNGAFREVGSGAALGNFTYSGGTTLQSQIVGQDFATSGNSVFLTGVAYSDAVNDNDFYDVGEGLAAITITAVRVGDNASYQTTTWSSGGYSLALPGGTYTVTATGAGLGGTVQFDDVVISSANIKRDFTPDLANPFATLSGGKLGVNGTSANDVVTLSLAQSKYTVTLNGASRTFTSSLVSSIEVLAGEGNDQVDLSSSLVPCYILGGAGNDTLIGGAASDTLSGGGGRDSLAGNAGNDRLGGMTHNDTLLGGDGDDRLYGDAGDDWLLGQGNVDRLWGGDGNDTLEGGSSNDKLFGEAGIDFLHGGNHNDYLDGGTGADHLFGDAGTDTATNDILDTRTSIEVLNGS